MAVGAESTTSLLGIDLGTSSVKVVLSDARGTILLRASAAYPVDRPQATWAETDPAAWWRAVRSAIGDLRSQSGWVPPRAIGLSGQMHGVVVCTAKAEPVRPAVLWSDTRATEELGRYRALPAAVRTALANPLSPGMAGPELAWLHEHEPDTIARARWALQPKDWLRARLTGRFATEPSDASATLLYNVFDQDWDAAVVAGLGLRRELLPTILASSGTRAGMLLPGPAEALGLPPGIPVAAGAADTAAAALGSGLTEPGVTQLTIGTGLQIVTAVRPPTPATVPAAPVTHLYRAATAHGWYAMAASLTGGQTLDWVRGILGAGWSELYAAAGRGPRPEDPIFLPQLAGERTPYLDPGLRGAWTGLAVNHDRTTLLYSALEGVAFAGADALDALPGRPPRARLRLAGGGSTAPEWRQLLADTLNAGLDAVDAPEASARGAALLAAEAAGLPVNHSSEPTRASPSTPVAEPGPRARLLGERRRRYRATLASLRAATRDMELR